MAKTKPELVKDFIALAWQRYHADIKGLNSRDPEYRQLESAAWRRLQTALKAVK